MTSKEKISAALRLAGGLAVTAAIIGLTLWRLRG
jgi:hypothetical protein